MGTGHYRPGRRSDRKALSQSAEWGAQPGPPQLQTAHSRKRFRTMFLQRDCSCRYLAYVCFENRCVERLYAASKNLGSRAALVPK